MGCYEAVGGEFGSKLTNRGWCGGCADLKVELFLFCFGPAVMVTRAPASTWGHGALVGAWWERGDSGFTGSRGWRRFIIIVQQTDASGGVVPIWLVSGVLVLLDQGCGFLMSLFCVHN